MALIKCAPVCVAAVAFLCLPLAPAHAGGRTLKAKAAAANPYRLIERDAQRSATLSSTTVIARWTEPPTFAIAPRTIGITLNGGYFERSAYAGPPQRGHAYNVRRKSS